MYRASDVANFICSYVERQDRSISNLRLQKILYYVQGYFLKEFDQPAFGEDIYNWTYGPVVPEVYFEFNHNMGNPIVGYDTDRADSFLIAIKRDKQAYRLLKKIVDACMEISVSKLVDKTHREDPWSNTARNQCISIDDVDEFFKDNDPLNIM